MEGLVDPSRDHPAYTVRIEDIDFRHPRSTHAASLHTNLTVSEGSSSFKEWDDVVFLSVTDTANRVKILAAECEAMAQNLRITKSFLAREKESVVIERNRANEGEQKVMEERAEANEGRYKADKERERATKAAGEVEELKKEKVAWEARLREVEGSIPARLMMHSRGESDLPALEAFKGFLVSPSLNGEIRLGTETNTENDDGEETRDVVKKLLILPFPRVPRWKWGSIEDVHWVGLGDLGLSTYSDLLLLLCYTAMSSDDGTTKLTTKLVSDAFPLPILNVG
ncbi:hypothetical protein NE237_029081 [Protea cynaroides]|uniref:Uncharacterized protein n=1 Tax=Protea cynaroides TaxID=273540 RepID=A0A9Q0JTH1_9MAGN|nr:hypothetical protein NE237_029081 [Protea cynaroides]